MKTKEKYYHISNSLYDELVDDDVVNEVLLSFADEIRKLPNNVLSQVHSASYSEKELSFLAFEQNPYELEIFKQIEYHSKGEKAYVINDSLYDELIKDDVKNGLALDFAYALGHYPNDVLFDVFGVGIWTLGQLSYLANFNCLGKQKPEDYKEVMEEEPYCYIFGIDNFFWWPEVY